jgi:hypothetical protein
MPDNATTIIVSPPLDAEDWQIAFEPYVNDPLSALVLAQRLSVLQTQLQGDAVRATAAINLAVDALYEHSEFRSVSLELFRVAIQGRLSLELENLIRQLGIRT